MKKPVMILISGRFWDISPLTIQETKAEISKGIGSSAVRWLTFLSPPYFHLAPSLLDEKIEIFPAEDEYAGLLAAAALTAADSYPPEEILFGLTASLSDPAWNRLNASLPAVLKRIDPQTLQILPDDAAGSALPFAPQPDQPRLSAAEVFSPEPSAPVFDLASAEWQNALIQYVNDNDGAVSATKAIEQIGKDFPGLVDTYRAGRSNVRAAIPDDLRWIEEEGIPKLYRADHPKLRPVSAQEAAANLVIGQGSGTAENEIPEDYKYQDNSATFADISARAALVAEYALWCRDRKNKDITLSDDVIRLRDQEFFAKAQELSVYFWMNNSEFPANTWEDLANGYYNISQAAALMQKVVDNPPPLKTLRNIATGYSKSVCLLKSLFMQINVPISADKVEKDAYENAVNFAKRERIHLSYLKRDDYLDPGQWEEHLAEIQQLAEEYASQTLSEKKQKNLYKKIAYHLKKAEEGGPDQMRDWQMVIDGVTSLCDDFHIPVSSVTLRELLSEYIAKIPEEIDITDTFADVVQQIDLFEESQAAAFQPEEVKNPPLSPSVEQVRQMYGMTKVVWVGGTPVEHLIQRIEKRFDVSIIWEAYTHGDSLNRFMKVLNDPDVKLFLVYIPWCSHKHSEELAQLAKTAHKDFVRLRKGTNPDQIALAICQQVQG